MFRFSSELSHNSTYSSELSQISEATNSKPSDDSVNDDIVSKV